MSSDQLIYDVGAHHGSDTAHYLESGYRVLAIEADPSIAQGLRERFAQPMNDRRLTVLQCGIAEQDGEAQFYICPQNTEWNSFDNGWARAHGAVSHPVTINCRSFKSILAEYGTPFFLKIDIEGSDALCVRALTPRTAPRFLSFETSPGDIDLLTHLRCIGYSRFSLVNQHSFQSVALAPIGSASYVRWAAMQFARRFVRTHPTLKGAIAAVRPRPKYNDKNGFRNDSAGPSPMERSAGWQSAEEFLRTWTSMVSSGALSASWFDVHASIA